MFKKAKQLKSVFILSSALLVSLSTFSCKDNDDKYVTPEVKITSADVVNDVMSFEKTAGEKSMTLSTSRAWKAEVSADWLTVTPTSGKEGDALLTVRVLDNSNGTDREGTIKISSASIVKNITVRQAGAPGSEVTSFNVNFEDGALPQGWTSVTKEGKRKWEIDSYKNNKFIKMSSFKTTESDKVMLISPKLRIESPMTLSFGLKVRYAVAGTKLKVLLLDENKNPIQELHVYDLNANNDDFVAQSFDIAANPNAKYIAFFYEGDPTKTSQAQLDNIVLGPQGSTPNLNPNPNPAPSGDAVSSFNVNFEGSTELPQGWTNKIIEGKRGWNVRPVKGNNLATMSSFAKDASAREVNKVMLVSPMVSIQSNSTLTFKMGVYKGVAGTIFKVLLLDANKNQIRELRSYDLAADKDLEEQTFDIEANADIKYIGFLYEGDPQKTGTINLDDIVLAPKGGSAPNPNPAPQPDPNPNPNPSPAPSPAPAPQPAAGGADVFIHLYYEGTQDNKYIVLYNPTSNPVDLSAYQLACDQWTNKGTHQGIVKAPLTGSIPANGFKVFANAKANAYQEDKDTSADPVFRFTGDDGVALLKGETAIDVLGTYGTQNKWEGGNKGYAADKILVRKSSVTAPSSTFNESQWDVITNLEDFSKFTSR